jgi:hypothetical protein
MHKPSTPFDGTRPDGSHAKLASPHDLTLQALGVDSRRADGDVQEPVDNHSPEWMAAIGRIGGQSRSAAKTRAARENGLKGGRPRKRETFAAGQDPNAIVRIAAGNSLASSAFMAAPLGTIAASTASANSSASGASER